MILRIHGAVNGPRGPHHAGHRGMPARRGAAGSARPERYSPAVAVAFWAASCDLMRSVASTSDSSLIAAAATGSLARAAATSRCWWYHSDSMLAESKDPCAPTILYARHWFHRV